MRQIELLLPQELQFLPANLVLRKVLFLLIRMVLTRDGGLILEMKPHQIGVIWLPLLSVAHLKA